MYRFSICFSATLFILSSTAANGQQQDPRGQARPAAGNTTAQPQVSQELYKLLDDWSRSSSRIKFLTGTHQRHVSNLAFATETISKGTFGYQSPDKGKIEMTPVKISKAFLAARNQPNAPVERGKDGKPFALKSATPERWMCDGEKVYDIDDAKKEARVVQLPPDQRGENIMNTPLPFLFGMPPDKAVKRFNIQIDKDYRSGGRPYVALSVTPRTRQDKDNWCLAQIILNTETFLPDAVKLTDPAKTKRTLYKFTEMSTEIPLWVRMKLKNPWDPKIRGYQQQLIQTNQTQDVAKLKPTGPVVPNLVSLAHNVAEEKLLAAGVPKANIIKKPSGPAPRANMKFRVSSQQPQAGSTLNPNGKFLLKIYTEPQQAQGVRPVGGSVRK